MKIAVFPGTFDPFTKGHASIVQKALPLFDKIIIAVGSNSKKSNLFSEAERMTWIQSVYEGNDKVTVEAIKGLTVEFCKEHQASFLLRGLRNANDFEYERSIAHMNQSLNDDVTTVFLLCDAELAAINASIVREIYKNGGDVAQFLPTPIVLPPVK
jgi:pantetheine-phosphate adenylyltransferase